MLGRFTLAFGGLCLLKAVDLAVRLPAHLPAAQARAFIALWIVAALGVGVGVWRRAGLCALVALAVAICVLTSWRMYNHHLVLIVMIALILALFPRDEQVTLLKAQLSIVYAFAAAAKVNAAYLSGAVLDDTLASGDMGRIVRFDGLEPALLQALAIASVAVEAGLAVALWFETTRRPAAVAGIVFHVVMVVFVSYGGLSVVRLVVFSGLMLALYLPFFDAHATSRAQAGVSGSSTVTSSPRYRVTTRSSSAMRAESR